MLGIFRKPTRPLDSAEAEQTRSTLLSSFGVRSASQRRKLSQPLLFITGAFVFAGCGGIDCNSDGDPLAFEGSNLRLSTTFVPTRLTLRHGETGEATVTIVKREGFSVEGIQEFEVKDTPYFDVTPNTFSHNFTGVDEVTQTLTFRVLDGAPAASDYISVVAWQYALGPKLLLADHLRMTVEPPYEMSPEASAQ